MQPEFMQPDFVADNSPEEIHERMMGNLPVDIDDMPGGFPYDFTMPAAIQKSEIVQFYIVRAIMAAFPQFAWDDWLDYQGMQVNLTRQKGALCIENTGRCRHRNRSRGCVLRPGNKVYAGDWIFFG